jgi:hypothetical protein
MTSLLINSSVKLNVIKNKNFTEKERPILYRRDKYLDQAFLVLGVSLYDFQAQNQCECCVSESEGGRIFHNYKPLGEKTEFLL